MSEQWTFWSICDRYVWEKRTSNRWARRLKRYHHFHHSILSKYLNLIPFVLVTYYCLQAKKLAKKDTKVFTMCGSFLQILKLSSHVCAFRIQRPMDNSAAEVSSINGLSPCPHLFKVLVLIFSSIFERVLSETKEEEKDCGQHWEGDHQFLYFVLYYLSFFIILFIVSQGNKVSAAKVRSVEQLILLILTIFADYVLLTMCTSK